MLNKYLAELQKEAASSQKTLEHQLDGMDATTLAKLAGVTLPEGCCSKCGGIMEKQGSVYFCNCGMMKKADSETDPEEDPATTVNRLQAAAPEQAKGLMGAGTHEKQAGLANVATKITGGTSGKVLKGAGVLAGGTALGTGGYLLGKKLLSSPKEAAAHDMPHFLDQDRPEKVKDIYRAIKREHPDMPAEMKARIAARKGKKSPEARKPPETGGPAYKAPLHFTRKGETYKAKKAGAAQILAKVASEEAAQHLTDFLQHNPAPEDEEIHELAGHEGMEPDELEELAYRLLAGKLDKTPELKHGDDPDSDFDPQQLEQGADVEQEHTDDPAMTKAIAKAHLAEIPDYYTHLKTMEEAAKEKSAGFEETEDPHVMKRTIKPKDAAYMSVGGLAAGAILPEFIQAIKQRTWEPNVPIKQRLLGGAIGATLFPALGYGLSKAFPYQKAPIPSRFPGESFHPEGKETLPHLPEESPVKTGSVRILDKVANIDGGEDMGSAAHHPDLKGGFASDISDAKEREIERLDVPGRVRRGFLTGGTLGGLGGGTLLGLGGGMLGKHLGHPILGSILGATAGGALGGLGGGALGGNIAASRATADQAVELNKLRNVAQMAYGMGHSAPQMQEPQQ